MSIQTKAQSVGKAPATLWHAWTVIIPRRTITGRLARGKVWRRWDGRRWIYKRINPS